MTDLKVLLAQTASRHSHLCPRQVLGVRAGLVGAAALGLAVPRTDKRLLVIIETDGCFADGVEVSSGASVGHRTLRVEDYGKTAVTFADTRTEMAVRVSPRLDIRQKAWEYSPDEKRHYFAMLHAYQIIPAEELFEVRPVQLSVPIREIVSRAGIRVDCDLCGEEIINEREIHRDNLTLCRACAGPAYYTQDPHSCAALSPNPFLKTQVVAVEDDPLLPPVEAVESSGIL